MKGGFSARAYAESLAHCISELRPMGTGMAVLFGGVQELLNQPEKSGEVAVLNRDEQYVY